MTKRQKYNLGDVFAVELDNGQSCLGYVTRKKPRTHIILRFFFARLYPNLPSTDQVPKLHAADAATIMRCSDMYLVSGRWPVIGHQEGWDNESWNAPKFYSPYELNGTPWLVTYDQTDLSRGVARR